MRSFCKGGIYEEFVNSKKFSLPEGEGGAARRAGETESEMEGRFMALLREEMGFLRGDDPG